jgi:hypothetical protein
MNEIKVTVTYEKPTTSKFDALMAEYEAAKKYADETVAYYKPLADAAEDAKFDAIMEQLETIKGYAQRISEITGKSVHIRAGVHAYMRGDTCSSDYFEVVYRPNETQYRFDIAFGHCPFVKGKFCSGRYNVVGKWEEWKMYEQLEKDACDKLRAAIENQKAKAQAQINRLNNITKGGN